MRISGWSSDVCASDLVEYRGWRLHGGPWQWIGDVASWPDECGQPDRSLSWAGLVAAMASGSVRMDGGDRQATRGSRRAGPDPPERLQRPGWDRVDVAVAAAKECRQGITAGQPYRPEAPL